MTETGQTSRNMVDAALLRRRRGRERERERDLVNPDVLLLSATA